MHVYHLRSYPVELLQHYIYIIIIVIMAGSFYSLFSILIAFVFVVIGFCFVFRFTQNLSVFRHNITDSLKAPAASLASNQNEMMSQRAPVQLFLWTASLVFCSTTVCSSLTSQLSNHWTETAETDDVFAFRFLFYDVSTAFVFFHIWIGYGDCHLNTVSS